MHVHYKYIDPLSEHYASDEAEPIRERAWAFFDEMDEMIGDMLTWAGEDAYVITMSDHGFGPKDKSVNVNVALREWGLLSVERRGRRDEVGRRSEAGPQSEEGAPEIGVAEGERARLRAPSTGPRPRRSRRPSRSRAST